MNINLVLRQLRFDGNSSEISQRKVIGRLNKICRIISEKFPEVQRPDQIKLKHLQYVRNEGLAGYSASTTVDYKRTIVILVEALERQRDWLPPLKLEKDPSKGGRPSSTQVIRTKSRNRKGVR